MTRAARALAHLGEVDPALAVLSLWCRHLDADGQTGTHGNTILYGPSFMSLGLPEQVGLVAHHVLHVALRHSDRQAGLAERLGAKFDPALFGLAADAIINETLLLAGHALPRPAVTLVDVLAAIGTPAHSPVAALQEWDTDRLAMALHTDAQKADKARKFGKTRGFVQDLEAGAADASEVEPSAADWRNQMLRAMEAGRKAGTGIGVLGAILADLSPARVPWEVQLRRALAKAVSAVPRPSYRRPSGQWLALAGQSMRAGTPEPVFQPGRARGDRRARIVVGLDTSSSIDDLTLSLFRAETEGISRRSGAEVHVLAFDEAVHMSLSLGDGTWRDVPLRTGGGTDYRPVIAAAASLDPSVLVMLTDLDAEFGPAPRFPVIWAVPGRASAVPFGRVLAIGD